MVLVWRVMDDSPNIITIRPCERLKDDDIVAAFVSMYMHIYSMKINFHEIVLPHESSKNYHPA